MVVYGISAWVTGADMTALQQIMNTAQNIACSRYLGRAKNIIKDTSHPGHHQFTLRPSGRRYGSSRAKTTRHLNSFFPQAIALLNSSHTPTSSYFIYLYLTLLLLHYLHSYLLFCSYCLVLSVLVLLFCVVLLFYLRYYSLHGENPKKFLVSVYMAK